MTVSQATDKRQPQLLFFLLKMYASKVLGLEVQGLEPFTPPPHHPALHLAISGLSVCREDSEPVWPSGKALGW